MKVAIYARVSTIDKNQNPETQLMSLRDHCTAQGWEVYKEYTDTASAVDIVHRTAWRQLQDDAAKHRFQAVVVFKLDRGFRSVRDMHNTLAVWETLGISFRSIREQFETSTALGRLLMNLLAALAEFELELIRERVRAGMERAARQGKRIGRPKVTDRRGFTDRYRSILERLNSGELSRRKAAKELGVGYATLKRLLDSNYLADKPSAMTDSNLDRRAVIKDA